MRLCRVPIRETLGLKLLHGPQTCSGRQCNKQDLNVKMNRYDPLETPNPEEWLAMDDVGRMRLVQDYHRRTRIRLPNAKLHALLHAIVENQIALGDQTPVQRTAQRLVAEGLDRHQAIHAIASVLSEHIYDLTDEPQLRTDPNQSYFAMLNRLTAEGWLRSDGPSDGGFSVCPLRARIIVALSRRHPCPFGGGRANGHHGNRYGPGGIAGLDELLTWKWKHRDGRLAAGAAMPRPRRAAHHHPRAAPRTDLRYPRRIAGEWHGLPEDCGGIPKFYHALAVLANPAHPDHDEVAAWHG